MQQQVRMFKKQLEEAEDIAANNLAKFKVVQKVGTIFILNFQSIHHFWIVQALVEAQEKAGETESEFERKKGLSRGASLVRDF